MQQVIDTTDAVARLAAEERPLPLAPPRRLSPLRVALALLVAPLVLAVPLEIVLGLWGAAFTQNRFLPNQDLNLRTLRMSEGELYRPREGNYPDYLAGFRINSMGFRGPDYGAKVPGACRILALGDSTVFGLFVEEEHAWPSILQGALRAHRPGAEVLNLGRVATSSHGTRYDVEHYAEQLQPDALIVSVGWYNDYQVLHEAPEWDERRAVADNLFDSEWRAAHSPLAVSSLYRIWRLWHWRGVGRRNVALDERLRTEGYHNAENADRPRRVPISQFEENLNAICDWAGERQIPLLLLTPEIHPDERPKFPLQARYAEAIVRIAAERGVPVADTRGLLRQREATMPPAETWLDFVHLQRPANRAVAELIETRIVELVPCLKQ